jgi:hypothetical protein
MAHLARATLVTSIMLTLVVAMSPAAIASDSMDRSSAGAVRGEYEQVRRNPEYGGRKWEFTIMPYFKSTRLDGSSTLGSITSDVSADARFLLDKFESGFAFHVEARNQGYPFTVMFDFSRLEIGDRQTLDGNPGTLLKWNFKENVWELLGAYRLRGNPGQWVELLGGVRVKDFAVRADASGGTEASGRLDVSWVDPVVGGRIIRSLSPSFVGILRGDIGGFGAGSDFTWNAVAGVGFMAGSVMIALENRYLDVDYTEGEGRERFAWDVAEQGILLGFGFHI